jgi:hypothetical protein
MNPNSERIPRRFCLAAVLRGQRGGFNGFKVDGFITTARQANNFNGEKGF